MRRAAAAASLPARRNGATRYGCGAGGSARRSRLRPDRRPGAWSGGGKRRVRARQVLNRRRGLGTRDHCNVKNLAADRVEGEALARRRPRRGRWRSMSPRARRGASDQPRSLAGQHGADLPRRQGLRRGLRRWLRTRRLLTGRQNGKELRARGRRRSRGRPPRNNAGRPASDAPRMSCSKFSRILRRSLRIRVPIDLCHKHDGRKVGATNIFDAQSGFLPSKHSGRLKLRRLFGEKVKKLLPSDAPCEPMTSCVAGANLAMSRADK